MHFILSLAALSVLSFSVQGTPVNRRPSLGTLRNTHRVYQRESGRRQVPGQLALEKAYLKYGIELPGHVLEARQAVQNGSISASPNPSSYDKEYLCSVAVGKSTLVLDFDTGSSDLWVFSSKLATSLTKGHAIYKLTGTLLNGYTWDISYADGSGAEGIVYADTVQVGGVTATSQAVEAATSISTEFAQDTNSDGLLGLGFSAINTVQPMQQTTFFDTVKSSLAAPLFAAALKKGAPGTYDFGWLDPSKYTGSIVYANVDSSQGYWQFNTTGYSVGKGAQQKYSLSAIADTGTSLILTDDALVSAFYAQVAGATLDPSYGAYTFPCSATLPTFSLFVNGQKRTLAGSTLSYGQITSTTCYGGIQSNSGVGFTILGDIFFKSLYVVFQNGASGPQLGLAQQKS